LIKIEKNWWKGFFNDIYLITDARSVCDETLTVKEVDIAVEMLRLKKHDRILDLCGGYGRHSLELAKRGYRDLSVLDYSDYLVKLGRRLARESGFKIRFYRSDARTTKLSRKTFTAVAIMANSFGYSPRDADNLRILKEAHRLLADKGRLLLDLADPDYVKERLSPVSWHEAKNNIIVCRERELRKDLIKAREVVLSKRDGLIRDKVYCERLYDKNKISLLLRRAGFGNIVVRKRGMVHKKKKDYGLLSARMFVVCEKE